MKIFETLGIDGEKIGECLGTVNSSKDAWKIIDRFKTEHKNDLKVEIYDRIIKLGPEKLAVDFGDYSRFILIESDGTKLDNSAVAEFWNPSEE